MGDNILQTCPVCHEKSLEPGERWDVGFGMEMGVKAGPDHCENCGYIEAGPDPHDLPLSHFQKCWAEGRDPHAHLKTMVQKPMGQRHKEWIEQNVGKDGGYGKCQEISTAMCQAFPELRQIYGTYHCPIWGPRNHFWCVTNNCEVVDPTARQFPSRGIGSYQMQYFTDEPVDENTTTS